MASYGAGLAAVSARALAHARNDDPRMLAAEVAWLDNGQLRRLIDAAERLRAAAQAELDGRGPR